MTPVEIKLSVVPDDELLTLKEQVGKLTEQVEKYDRLISGLRNNYNELLIVLSDLKKSR